MLDLLVNQDTENVSQIKHMLFLNLYYSFKI